MTSFHFFPLMSYKGVYRKITCIKEKWVNSTSNVDMVYIVNEDHQHTAAYKGSCNGIF